MLIKATVIEAQKSHGAGATQRLDVLLPFQAIAYLRVQGGDSYQIFLIKAYAESFPFTIGSIVAQIPKEQFEKL